MKNILSLAILLIAMCSSALAAKPKSEKLLLAGSGNKKVYLIDKQTTQVEWEYTLEPGTEVNCLSSLKNGAVLIAYKKGVKAITLKNKVLWDIKAQENQEFHTVELLPNGNCLVAVCGLPAVVMEVSPKGKILRQFTYDTEVQRPHGQFRQASKTHEGNYLIPLMGGMIHHVSPEGKLINKFKVKGNPFALDHIAGDRYLVAGGGASLLQIVDIKTGKIEKEYGTTDIAGAPFWFVADIFTSGQTYYVANWHGHNKDKVDLSDYPQAIQITAGGQLLWKLVKPELGQISAVCVY